MTDPIMKLASRVQKLMADRDALLSDLAEVEVPDPPIGMSQRAESLMLSEFVDEVIVPLIERAKRLRGTDG